MTVTVEGTVPFPPGTDAAPLLQMGQSFAQLSRGLSTGARGISQTTTAAQQVWVGQAASAFTAHMTGRVNVVNGVAQALSAVQGVMSAFATNLEGAEQAYTAAAVEEQAARAGLPWTAGALAEAIVAEEVAVAMLEVAGAACAAQLMAIVAKVGLAELAPLGQMIGGEAGQIISTVGGAAIAVENGVKTFAKNPMGTIINGLNTVSSAVGPGGATVKTTPTGTVLNGIPGVTQVESAVSTATVLSEPTLTNRPLDPNAASQLLAAGYNPNATTATDVAKNLNLLEVTQRSPGDESMVVGVTSGTRPDGRTALTVYLPGIVSPQNGSSLPDDSGNRSLFNAGASQLGNVGQGEAALYNWVQAQNLPAGSVINLVGHSQGGIEAQNLANQLSAAGYQANVVTMGSPPQQLSPNVNAVIGVNTADPVPAATILGSSGSGYTQYPNQTTVTFNAQPDPSSVLSAHDPYTYGNNMDTTALTNLLRQWSPAPGTATSGFVAFQGPAPLATPYRIPPPPK